MKPIKQGLILAITAASLNFGSVNGALANRDFNQFVDFSKYVETLNAELKREYEIPRDFKYSLPPVNTFLRSFIKTQLCNEDFLNGGVYKVVNEDLKPRSCNNLYDGILGFRTGDVKELEFHTKGECGPYIKVVYEVSINNLETRTWPYKDKHGICIGDLGENAEEQIKSIQKQIKDYAESFSFKQ